MAPSLDGPKAKLARAREHLEALYREMLSFMKTDPFRVRHQVDPKNGDDVWRLDVRELPPVRLSVIAGDVAHSLRSSLDHLVWQLALTHTSKPYSRAEFPIYSLKSDKVRQCFDKHGMAKIKDLPPDAQKLIESVQPYHRRNTAARALSLLAELNNIDKHRMPLRVLARQTGLRLPAWCVDYLDAIPGPRNHGDVVLRLRRNAGRPDLDEHDKKGIGVTFDLAISTRRASANRMGIIATFNRIHQAIDEELLTKCERFF